MTQDLGGKVAIVTGAGVAGGIGEETARLLAAAGARVLIADLPATDTDATLAAIGDAGEVVSHPVDIADESSVKALMEFAIARFGRVDILDNNAARAGLAGDGLLADMDAALWDSVFEVNARGTMLMCKHAIPHMIAGGGGSIVNIASDTTRAGDDFATAYACSKGALVVLTRYIATQYGRYGIRCNAISPGVIKTSKMADVLPESLQEVWVAEKLVGRFGTPHDIAEAVLFLASDRSAFLTGEVISVNGGLLAHMPMLQGTRALASAGTES
jgi:NAD(P)-dependent dehydrogenase (short-subunit alcohol dehydrogenase family)